MKVVKNGFEVLYELTCMSEHELKKNNIKGNTKYRQGRSTRSQPYKRIIGI